MRRRQQSGVATCEVFRTQTMLVQTTITVRLCLQPALLIIQARLEHQLRRIRFTKPRHHQYLARL